MKRWEKRERKGTERERERRVSGGYTARTADVEEGPGRSEAV